MVFNHNSRSIVEIRLSQDGRWHCLAVSVGHGSGWSRGDVLNMYNRRRSSRRRRVGDRIASTGSTKVLFYDRCPVRVRSGN